MTMWLVEGGTNALVGGEGIGNWVGTGSGSCEEKIHLG